MNSITLTWNNVFAIVGLVIVILLAGVTGTAFIVQWRIGSIQYQLTDRMISYQKDIDRITQRLDKIEERIIDGNGKK